MTGVTDKPLTHCKGYCTMSFGGDYCKSCLVTKEEKAEFLKLSREEKKQFLDKLNIRQLQKVNT